MKVKKTAYQMLKLNQLKKADWNYKEDDKDQMANLVENIKRNNQVENIQVRELGDDKYEIVNGNHRLEAMMLAGFKEAMCYNHGTISLNEAKRIAIETNETRFASNSLKLSEAIKELAEDFDVQELALTLPFTEDEIQGHIDLLDFDFTDLNTTDDGIGEYDPDNPETWKTIAVKVPEETYHLWLNWVLKTKELLGYENDFKALEFALVEATNMPDESILGHNN